MTLNNKIVTNNDPKTPKLKKFDMKSANFLRILALTLKVLTNFNPKTKILNNYLNYFSPTLKMMTNFYLKTSLEQQSS